MKPGTRQLPCIAGTILTLAVAFLAGCDSGPSTSGNPPADLVVNLGGKAKIQLVWIESMQLYVGKYELSNKNYRRFQPKHNSGQHSGQDLNQDNQPVVNVNWSDAQQYCQWLTKNRGTSGTRHYRFRLPTEKEWETFATCGKDQEYPWGPEWPPPKKWNYFGWENPEPAQKLANNDGFRVACPVTKSGDNAWRLFGLGGNVWEWCEDTDGPSSKSRIFKGASWADCNPYFLKLSRRSSNAPDSRDVNRGFRIVADSDSANSRPESK